MCVVGYLWGKFAAGCCCSVGTKGWASRRRSTYWSFKSLGFDEGTEVGLMVIWGVFGMKRRLLEAWVKSSWAVANVLACQASWGNDCWHDFTAVHAHKINSYKFLWHVVPILWCDRRWQKQPSPNEPWLLQISSRLASTKEVDLKSKVQQEFYRNERKRQGHSAIVECHIHNWPGHQTWNFVPGKLDPFHHPRVTFSHDMPSVGIKLQAFCDSLEMFHALQWWNVVFHFEICLWIRIIVFLARVFPSVGSQKTDKCWLILSSVLIYYCPIFCNSRFMFSIFKLSVYVFLNVSYLCCSFVWVEDFATPWGLPLQDDFFTLGINVPSLVVDSFKHPNELLKFLFSKVAMPSYFPWRMAEVWGLWFPMLTQLCKRVARSWITCRDFKSSIDINVDEQCQKTCANDNNSLGDGCWNASKSVVRS